MATKTAAVPAPVQVALIPLGQLSPSPTNPRKRFPAESITELAASILKMVEDPDGEMVRQGIIQPLTVRVSSAETKKGDSIYEIVCGERRYRAATEAGLTEAPCIVRSLTDEEVLDLQIHENLHREDVHPMDEALGYKFLQDKLGCTTAELALRVGKSEKYVLTRLKLNTLIPEVQADIEAGHLPLTYALEIAKVAPDAQKLVLEHGAYHQDQHWSNGRWNYTPDKTKLLPFASLLAYINSEVLMRLSSAPFSTKATDLRPDGLACIACPSRTGANAGLFDADMVGKNDACLDPVCFKAKTERLVVVTRERVAHEACIEVKDVPLVHFDLYNDEAGLLGIYSFTIIGKKPYKSYWGNNSEKPCDKTVTAVNLSSGQYGKTYQVCLKSSGCNVHYKGVSAAPKPKSGKAAEAEREHELDLKRQRREELFDCRVSDIVRKQVFRQAAESFADTFAMQGEGPESFLAEAITKIALISNNDIDTSTAARVVMPIMREVMDEPKFMEGNGYYRPYGSSDTETSTYKQISALSDRNQRMMFFLFVHGNKGQTYNDTWKSQREVRALAEFYGIDYPLLDARARVEVCEEKAKKHVERFKTYLADVEAGKSAEIPRIWSENWKPKD